MLLGRLVRILGLAHLVVGAIAATLLLSTPNIRRYGDNLQIALPLIAWSCSATKGAGSEYVLRFALTMAITHDTKVALGQSALNHRPSGGYSGFPSGHTAAAASGASAIVFDCVRGNIAAQGIVVMAAALVGTSRIVVGAHDIVQVLAGALLALGIDRVLRRRPGRAALVRWIARARAHLRLDSLGQASALRLVLGAALMSIGLVFGLAQVAS